MTIELNDDLLGIFACQLSPRSDFMAGLSRLPAEPGRYLVLYRTKFYGSARPFDPSDQREWIGRSVGADDDATAIYKFLQIFRRFAKTFSDAPLTDVVEIIRSPGVTTDQMSVQLLATPWFHAKAMSRAQLDAYEA